MSYLTSGAFNQQAMLTKRDACRVLGVSVPTIDRLVNQGRIPAINIGTGRTRFLRFHLSDLNEFMVTRRTVTSEQGE